MKFEEYLGEDAPRSAVLKEIKNKITTAFKTAKNHEAKGWRQNTFTVISKAQYYFTLDILKKGLGPEWQQGRKPYGVEGTAFELHKPIEGTSMREAILIEFKGKEKDYKVYISVDA